MQERLGHSSIEMTLDIYSHVTPGLQEVAALRSDDVLTHKPADEESGSLVSNPLAK
jgi:integrase